VSGGFKKDGKKRMFREKDSKTWRDPGHVNLSGIHTIAMNCGKGPFLKNVVQGIERKEGKKTRERLQKKTAPRKLGRKIGKKT